MTSIKQKKDYFKDEPTALDLYSFWITAFFLIWLILGKVLPYWMNPYITIYVGTIVQLIIFYLGRKFVPKILFITIALWKWIIFTIALFTFNRSFDLKTINFNLALLLTYLLVIYMRGYHVFGVYLDYVLNEKRYFSLNNPLDFFEKRLKTIF